MTSEPTTVVEQPIVKEKKKHGCFFRGCIGCAGFGLVLLIVLAIGTWYAWTHAHRFAVERSSDRPLEMRDITLSGNTTELLERWEELEDVLENGGSGTYIIDQEMIDAQLLTPENKHILDVVLGSGEVEVLLSVPLEKLDIDELASRYFNVQARGTFGYDAGKIEAYILDVDIPGKQLSHELVDELQGENIGPHFYREEEFVEFIQQFESIILSGDEVVLEFRE